MSLLNSATTFVEDTSKIIATSIKEFASDIGLDFEEIPKISLPIPNILHNYATYDYILTISVLHDKDIEDPDNSYFKNKTLQPGDRYGSPPQIICKSANADPDNRVKLDYGKFDYFIDNLKVEGNVGFIQGNNTTSTNVSFEIYEPFSMGLFTMACQQAAWDADHRNWNEAPFLLTIEFRGNVETGTMLPIPSATRFIPFKFQNISMKVDTTGSHYNVSAYVWNDIGLADKHAKLKTDMSIKGTTVQEILQTGENSLQAVWNKRLQQFKADKIVEVPDEIVILFPKEIASDTSSDSNSSATTGSASASTLFEKLGVSTSKVYDHMHVQKPEDCNIIGKASLGFGTEKTPDPSYGKENKIYDADKMAYVRANNTPKPTECDFKFRQDSDIPNAINQVLLQSTFPTESLKPEGTSPSGYKKWWKIDIQVYNISTEANYPLTGTKPKIIVYRVIPYNAHASSGIVAPGQKPPGFDLLTSNIIKEYNYIYTGKNVDVVNFEIKLESTFSAMMAADYSKGSQDIKNAAQQGATTKEKDVNTVAVLGNPPEKGTNPTSTSYIATFMQTDKHGGGGTETAGTRAAKLFHDAITKGGEMIDLNMKIIGDPMFLHHSGFGNYTSKPTQYPNLNKDGTVNYQMGEVNIIVNFRVPVDLDQTTGTYKFDGMFPTSPLLQFSGIYTVRQVVSTFTKGMFEQTLTGSRATMQESAATDESSFSMSDFTKNGMKALKKITGGF